MENLESTWKKLNYQPKNIDMTITQQKDFIFDKLRKEEKLRKQYNPFLAVAILLFTCVFSYLVYQENNTIDTTKIVGILFVTLAGISISVLSQIVKIPFDKLTHSNSTVEFLNIVKSKLDKAKKMLVVGTILQILFLTLGLYLIIYHGNNDSSNGSLFLFLGVMSGLGGAAIGGCIGFFNTHYRDTYGVIEEFGK